MSLYFTISCRAGSSETGKIEKDVIYGKADNADLKMDIYYPAEGTGNSPALIYVHGGAWIEGDKSSGVGIKYIPDLVKRGYLVASVNYRLAPKYKFPAQIEDVKCAVRFLRFNAKKYGINPEKIGAFGGSAGGHIVLLLGLSGSDKFNNSGGYEGQSSKVKAVVDLFGPSDLTVTFDKKGMKLIEEVFGTSDCNSEILKSASPVSYISSEDPPFLIIHGEKDRVVQFSQSQELYDKLKKAGLDATLVRVKNAGHGFIAFGGKIDPSREEIGVMIADFFDRSLK